MADSSASKNDVETWFLDEPVHEPLWLSPIKQPFFGGPWSESSCAFVALPQACALAPDLLVAVRL